MAKALRPIALLGLTLVGGKLSPASDELLGFM
jgi:hypothetical protein